MSTDISKVNSSTVTDYARMQATSSVPAVKAPEAPAVELHKSQSVETKLSVEDKQKNLKEAIAQLNQQMASSNQHLGFELNDHIKGPVITVQNTQTGEVVRKIPSEEVLRVAQSIDSLKGVIFNKNL